MNRPKRSLSAARTLLPVLLLGTVAACSSVPSLPGTSSAPEIDRSAVEFRRERFEAVSAREQFTACFDEGVAMDRSARQSGNAGQYRRAAEILERCVVEHGEAGSVPEDERMRTLALAIQDHAKAGDVARAREILNGFQSRFGGRDLYYPDGTAFTEAMEMALGMASTADAGVFSTANVNPTLKAEIRRQHYWETH